MADVLPPPHSLRDSPFASPTPTLRRSPHSPPNLLLDASRSHSHSSPDLTSKRPHVEDREWLPTSEGASPTLSTDRSFNSSFSSTPASSLEGGPYSDDTTLTTISTDDACDSLLDDDEECAADAAVRSSKPSEATLNSPPPSPLVQRRDGSDDFSPPTPATPVASQDDTHVHAEPSQHVDYLSHEWREEDLWSSWRHIVSQRKTYGESSRFENASWRSWAKQKNKLPTLDPSELNWLKDVDVTWLYGPFKSAHDTYCSSMASELPSRLSRTNSYINKKPILKKRSMSEVMLQHSISNSSLVRQAAMAVQEQRWRQGQRLRATIQNDARPALDRSLSDFSHAAQLVSDSTASTDRSESMSSEDFFARSQSTSTSGRHSPEDVCREKHIRFDDTVEQCIAVESDEDLESLYASPRPQRSSDDDDDSSEEDLVMMKPSPKARHFSHSSTFPPHRHGSSSAANSRTQTRSNSMSTPTTKITIEKLPATKLKYRTDSPDIPDLPLNNSLRIPHVNSLENLRSSGLRGKHSLGRRQVNPSDSQETLRPAHPSKNFLLAEEDLDDEALAALRGGPHMPHHTDSEDEHDSPPRRPAHVRRDSIAIHRNRGSPRGSATRLTDDVPPHLSDNSRRLGTHFHTGEESEFGEAEFEDGFEDEDEDATGKGVLGRVVDTVNTVRDIAYVVWNVGWRN